MTAQSADPAAETPATIGQFAALDLRIGTVRSAAPNPRARRPAYVLTTDFGPLGEKCSSAQITDRYAPDELIGRQVVAVVNFPPKRIAGVKSEVLVLGAVDVGGVTLLRPDAPVPDGSAVM